MGGAVSKPYGLDRDGNGSCEKACETIVKASAGPFCELHCWTGGEVEELETIF